MGYNNNLLYWDPILEEFLKEFPNTEFLTYETTAKLSKSRHPINNTAPVLEINFFGDPKKIPSPKIIKTLKEKSPDLLIISEFGLPSIYASIFKRISKRTKILLLVENDPSYLEHFYNVNRKNFIHSTIRRQIVKYADMILCNNASGRDYVITELSAKESSVTTGCYLTSQVATKNNKLSPSPTELKLLFIGRLIRGKGVHFLIEAISILNKSQRSVFVDIVGEGPEREHLEHQVKRHNLESIIKFHGGQPYEKIGDFLSKADVFVLPTLGDYRALVGFEAVSAGLPIIGSIFDGAANEVIEEGKNGFIVNPQKPEQIKESIEFFLNNQEELSRFSANSLEKSKEFTVNSAANNLILACINCMHLPNKKQTKINNTSSTIKNQND